MLHVGDLSYADGDPKSWVKFLKEIEFISSKVPYMVAIGNHDYSYKGMLSYVSNHYELSLYLILRFYPTKGNLALYITRWSITPQDSLLPKNHNLFIFSVRWYLGFVIHHGWPIVPGLLFVLLYYAMLCYYIILYVFFWG